VQLTHPIVTPAQAGVHLTDSTGGGMDSGLRRNDDVLVDVLGAEI